ncbi:MAG: flagellar hook-basal body protein [Nitrospinae bacterium]|nr:flagellar hook-basal body protein [Nitrospinota bacterium]
MDKGIFVAASAGVAQERVMDIISNNQGNDSIYMIGSQSFTDFSAGSLKKTDNQLDVALDGSGFIAVETQDGERFSRGGSLKLDGEGTLVTNEGFPVMDKNGGNITLVDKKDYTIRVDGTISTTDGLDVAQIKVVDFSDKSGLEKIGAGLYKANDTSVMTDSPALVSQGFVEASNVNPMGEVTRMMNAMRAYEAFQKSVQTHDQMNQRLISDVAR